MAGNISKIERVQAPRSPKLWVDLCLDKRRGSFFAVVNGDKIESATKADAVKKIEDALSKITDVVWRQVIVLRVHKIPENERPESENGLAVLSAECSFTYMRRERAANPISPKDQIERSHSLDFEKHVAEIRDRAGWGFGDKASKKKRADEAEADARQGRATLANVREPWVPREAGIVEHEIPYTEAAWEGIDRIVAALRATQVKLDELAAAATPAKLASFNGLMLPSAKRR